MSSPILYLFFQFISFSFYILHFGAKSKTFLPSPRSQIFPIFAWKWSSLMFYILVYEQFCVTFVRWDLGYGSFFFLTCGGTIPPAPFIFETIFRLLNCFYVVGHICFSLSLGFLFDCIGLHLPLHQFHTILIIMNICLQFA